MNKLLDHFERFALLALEKQDKLSAAVGEHFFEFDLDSGKALLGGGLECFVQVLGTQSDNTLTWLWAWAEEQAEVPEALIASAMELREWGARQGVPEFTEPQIDLDRADGTMIAMIATEVTRASCFYRDAYDGGALYLLLTGDAIDRQAPLNAHRLAGHLKELAAEHEIDPRNALLSYLRAKGIPFTEEGTTVGCLLADGEEFRMEFDEQGRLLGDE